MNKLLSLILLLCLNIAFGQSVDAPLQITHLTSDFYIYKTFSEYKGTKISANGMYVVTHEGVVLIDSPWDTTQFQPLLDSIEKRHAKKVTLCIATHFHEDRTGGLEYYRQQGIRTYTTALTDRLSKERGMKRAEYLIQNDTLFTVGQYRFQTYHPGHGHTADNIVVWFENEKILYGGCLTKSYEDTTLGNLADASAQEYASTVSKVLDKCKTFNYVIPGHNGWSRNTSVSHTLKMAKELK